MNFKAAKNGIVAQYPLEWCMNFWERPRSESIRNEPMRLNDKSSIVSQQLCMVHSSSVSAVTGISDI